VCHSTVTTPLEAKELYGKVEETLKTLGKDVNVTSITLNVWVDGPTQKPVKYDNSGNIVED
jgi:hypothetical protein